MGLVQGPNWAMPWDFDLRRDLEQGNEDKGACMHARVRQGQAGFMQGLGAIEEEIQIQSAGGVAKQTAAAEADLQLEQGLKQGAGGLVCLDLGDGIDVIRLVCVTGRQALVQAGVAHELRLRQVAQFAECPSDLLDGIVITRCIAQIASERDIGGELG